MVLSLVRGRKSEIHGLRNLVSHRHPSEFEFKQKLCGIKGWLNGDPRADKSYVLELVRDIDTTLSLLGMVDYDSDRTLNISSARQKESLGEALSSVLPWLDYPKILSLNQQNIVIERLCQRGVRSLLAELASIQNQEDNDDMLRWLIQELSNDQNDINQHLVCPGGSLFSIVRPDHRSILYSLQASLLELQCFILSIPEKRSACVSKERDAIKRTLALMNLLDQGNGNVLLSPSQAL